MSKSKEEILELMKNLPIEMIEEFEEANLMPYKKKTIEILIHLFNRNNLTTATVGYTEKVIAEIELF